MRTTYLNQTSDQSRQSVVITKSQLLNSYGVIFVHNRDNAKAQKLTECIESVGVVMLLVEVFSRWEE